MLESECFVHFDLVFFWYFKKMAIVVVDFLIQKLKLIKTCGLFLGDNGLNPIWNESVSIEICNSALAFLRFTVQDEDMFGDANFIGQATYPVSCLRPGFRSVILRNGFSEKIDLAALLIHLKIENISL